MARQRTPLMSGIVALAIITTSALAASPAVADSLPDADCVVNCTATFTGGTGLYAIPAGVTSVRVTVAGGAGAVPAAVSSLFPDAVGGAGGVTTVDLGAAYGGTTLGYRVSGTGGASGIAAAGSMVVSAGGGGGAGYMGRLDLADPDQISGVYAGGAGGAPTTPGYAAGGDGTAPGANGTGAFGPTSGHPGTGTVADGNDGFSDPGVIASVPTFGAGGAGATAGSPSFAATHTAGSGGGGIGGGGGGGLTTLDVDEITYGIVGAGGGGAGYLAGGLTGTAGTNTGSGYVTIRWSFSPTITTSVAQIARGELVTAAVAGLPASRAFKVLWDGKTVASLTSDTSGAASVSFTVASAHRLGKFPLRLSVGGTVVASTGDIEVAELLAATGSRDVTVPALFAGSVTLLGVMLLLGSIVVRRRRELGA